jgi:hypothetical protein
MSSELQARAHAFKKLEAALKCEAHKGHCLVDRTGGHDNHRRLSHCDMTEWAIKIVSGRLWRYCVCTHLSVGIWRGNYLHPPPHSVNFDRMPAKKPRVSGSAPEVHVAVNFGSPLPGTEASYTVNGTTHHVVQQPLASSSGTSSKLERALKRPNLPVRLLLELMDLDDLTIDLKYVDVEEQLKDNGMTGILEVYETPMELLVKIGCLGSDGASCLHKYIKERLLPVIQGEGMVSGEKEGAASGEEEGTESGEKEGVASGKQIEVAGGKRLVKKESKEEVIVWPSDERDPLGEDKIEEELPPIEVLDEDNDEISGYDTT